MPSERQFLHDLSSPLSVALMLAEITLDGLNSGAPPEEAKAQLARMSKNIRRMRQMMDTRRAFLKGEFHESA